jgi:quercetin dioxygenase-like cupin family protein
MKQTNAIVTESRLIPLGLFIVTLFLSTLVQGQDTTGHSIVRNLAEIKFAPFPGLPTSAPGFVQSGDPAKGASVIISKIKAGSIIPWHWHTPNEHLMMVSGAATVQMKGEKPMTLRAGGFAMMPSQHVHQFRCIQDCVMYIYSDTAFDIHYVDQQGNEISPEQALKAVKETTVKEPK